MKGAAMGKLQWAGLCAVALVAATWANGTGTLVGIIASGLIGFAAGWLFATRVLR